MYVIQYRTRGDGFKPGTWQPCCVGGVPKRYNTLSDARAAYDALPRVLRPDYRIAEEYTVTRYKLVKHPA